MIALECGVRIGGVLLLGTLTGCATTFGTLHGVTWDNRVATEAERSQVRVTRKGESQRVYAGMSIQKADQIATSHHTRVVLLLGGYEVALDTGTVVTIENPSIFVTIGDVFAKVAEEVGAAARAVREALTINSEFTTAAVRGTEFLFSVDREQVVTLTVLEGEVSAQPRDGRHPPAVYGPLQRGRLRPGQPPERMGAVSRDAAERTVQWARDAISTVVVRVPDVRRLPLAEARSRLERQGFKVLVTGQRATGTVPAGSVLDQSPGPDRSARPEEFVSLTVEAESLELPDVRGMPLRDAMRRLQALGLETRVSRPERRDTVVRRALRGDSVDVVEDQRPPARSRVATGSRVELIVPQARRVPPPPPPPQPPSPQTCTMPNVKELDERTARSRLKEAGFGTVRVLYGTGTRVTYQSPAAGRREPCGTPVDIRIGSVIE